MNDILTPDPREEKLPKWARDSLRVLRMRVTEARADANAGLSLDNPRINAWVQATGDGLPEYLPSNHRIVRFFVGPSEYDWVEIMVRNPLCGVEVRTNDEMHIQPSASNVVEIRPMRAMLAEPPRHLRRHK